jgi:Ca2+-binding RTX toxin-like protein
MALLTVLGYDNVGPDFSTEDVFHPDFIFYDATETLIRYQIDGQAWLYVYGPFVIDGNGVISGDVTSVELRTADGATIVASVTGITLPFPDFDEKLRRVNASNTEAVLDSTVFSGNDSMDGGAGIDLLDGSDGADTINGNDGDDSLIGNNGDDTLNGGNGNDYLEGGFDNDLIEGGAGDDILAGGPGDDTLVPGSGNDHVIGGGGFDIVDFSDAASGLIIDVFGDIWDGGAAGDTVEAVSGIIGSAFADSILATAPSATEPFVLVGNGGNDTLVGGTGDDTLLSKGDPTDTDLMQGGLGNDSIVADGSFLALMYGEAGDDTIVGGAGFAWMVGGPGADTYVAGTGINVVSYSDASGVGVLLDLRTPANSTGDAAGDVIPADITIFVTTNLDDTVIASDADGTTHLFNGNDSFVGGSGLDIVAGYDGKDTIHGNDGNDFLMGNGGDDLLHGGAGQDGLIGDDGNDTIYGGLGNDVANGLDGQDLVLGEEGDDFLMGGAGNDTIHGGLGNDVLVGGAFYNETASDLDSLFGGEGNDFLLVGLAGKAWLDGGTGNDIIYGGPGNDTIIGGAGSDNLFGFGGTDTFLFNAADIVAGDFDVISDLGTNETIMLPIAYNTSYFISSNGDGSVSLVIPVAGGMFGIYILNSSEFIVRASLDFF